MKYLIVSGCSFTAKDHSWQFQGRQRVDKKWPAHLKDMIDPNLTLINLAHSGAGNEYIYTSLKNEILKLEPDDIFLVIAAWSGGMRDDWESPYKQFQKNHNWVHENLAYKSNHLKRFHKARDFMAARTTNWRWCLQKLSKELNFDYIEVNMYNDPCLAFIEEMRLNAYNDPMYKSLNSSLTDSHNIQMGYDVTTSINDFLLLDEDRVSKDDHHPNSDGHKKIAEWMYNEIQHMGY